MVAPLATLYMFLTTNRMSEFDEAILSRIHLKLKYDDLRKEY